jgi:hypothetical protein
MHQMHISTNYAYAVILRPKKFEIQNVMTVEPRTKPKENGVKWSQIRPRVELSVRIRVRIGPLHPPCMPQEVTDWGGPLDEAGKTEVPCHSISGTIKIPPCSKALSAELRPKPISVFSPNPIEFLWKATFRTHLYKSDIEF